MPNRMVRDDLLTSERYWSCSPEARNLYVSILLSADDCARYTASNFALRTKCMAGTVNAERIDKLLTELVDVDLVRVYEHEDARYLFVPRFRQRLRYTNSRYPDPPIGINDIAIKKTDSGQSQDGLKTAEVKRSEEKRSNTVARGTRLDPNFIPSEKTKTWVSQKRPDLDLTETLEAFRDHWTAVPGSKGVKLDWDKTFKNWCRNQRTSNVKSGKMEGLV